MENQTWGKAGSAQPVRGSCGTDWPGPWLGTGGPTGQRVYAHTCVFTHTHTHTQRRLWLRGPALDSLQRSCLLILALTPRPRPWCFALCYWPVRSRSRSRPRPGSRPISGSMQAWGSAVIGLLLSPLPLSHGYSPLLVLPCLGRPCLPCPCVLAPQPPGPFHPPWRSSLAGGSARASSGVSQPLQDGASSMGGRRGLGGKEGALRALGVARDRDAAGVHPWRCSGSFSACGIRAI